MHIDIEKKILRFATMTVAAACPVALALTQEQPRHPSAGTPTLPPTGQVLAQHISVSFAPRPSEQAMEQNLMNPVWESLGYMRTVSRLGGFVAMLILNFVLTARGGTKLLTTDPLTGLPLHPATDSRLHLAMSLLGCRNRKSVKAKGRLISTRFTTPK
jgi:hypothetical protein